MPSWADVWGFAKEYVSRGMVWFVLAVAATLLGVSAYNVSSNNGCLRIGEILRVGACLSPSVDRITAGKWNKGAIESQTGPTGVRGEILSNNLIRFTFESKKYKIPPYMVVSSTDAVRVDVQSINPNYADVRVQTYPNGFLDPQSTFWFVIVPPDQ